MPGYVAEWVTLVYEGGGAAMLSASRLDSCLIVWLAAAMRFWCARGVAVINMHEGGSTHAVANEMGINLMESKSK